MGRGDYFLLAPLTRSSEGTLFRSHSVSMNQTGALRCPHDSARPPFWFSLLKKQRIRSVTRADVEGGGAVGKTSRTAAGRAASLTIVWHQFRFQLCTTLLFSSSPASPAYIFMYAVKRSLFFNLFCPPLSALNFFCL